MFLQPYFELSLRWILIDYEHHLQFRIKWKKGPEWSL